MTPMAAAGMGAGAGSATPQTAAPDFSLSVEPLLTTAPGGTALATVSYKPINGFKGEIALAITGLPSTTHVSYASTNIGLIAPGVTVPSELFLMDFYTYVNPGTYDFTITGTSGTLKHTASGKVVVKQSSYAAFEVVLNFFEFSMARGGNAANGIGISLTGDGDGSGSIEYSVLGLPVGVKATFGQNPAAMDDPGNWLAISANSTATLANYQTVIVVATRAADGFQSATTFLLNVTPLVGTLPGNRTKFVRTDGTQAGAAYDAAHDRLFVSNPDWNRIDVISVATGKITSSIPAQQPTGLALTPDGTQLIAGSYLNQILTIDAGSLQVVERTPVPASLAASTQSIEPVQVLPMANGNVLLGFSPGADDYTLAKWDPKANTFTGLSPFGPRNNRLGALVASASGKNMLAVTIYDGEASHMALFDAASDSFAVQALSPVGQLNSIAANPLGTGFAVAGAGGLALLNDELQTTDMPMLPASGYVVGMAYSPDGTRLLVDYDASYSRVLLTLDAATGALLGVAPDASYCGWSDSCNSEVLAADNNGFVFFTAGNGLVFADADNFQNILDLPANSPIPTSTRLSPNEAPLGKPLPTQFLNTGYDVPPDVWFGDARGTRIANGPADLDATAPASETPGMVDVKTVFPDGWYTMAPQAFSYGSQILFTSAQVTGTNGNVKLDLIGYGLIGDGSGIAVSIGGQRASVLSATNYQSPSPQAPVLSLLDDVQVLVPEGPVGLADITLTSRSGTSTIKNGFTYLPGIIDYYLADSPTNILFDAKRDRVYLAAKTQIDVFDAATREFLTPITPPTAKRVRQLDGMALTPDGSKLLIVDSNNIQLLIVDPDSPTKIVRVAVQPGATVYYAGASSVAATSTNKAIVGVVAQTSVMCPSGPYYEVDLSKLTVSTLSIPGVSCIPGEAQVLSDTKGDNVIAAGGGAALWNVTENQWTSLPFAGGYDAAFSGDGYWYSSGMMAFNPQLWEQTQLQVPVFFGGGTYGYPETLMPGAKLNSSGSLLYQPLGQNIDVMDVNRGTWLRRIVMPENVQFAQNPMALDEASNRLFLITNEGLTVIQMDAPQLSIGYLNPPSGPQAGGTTVTVRGSGFEPGATVKIGGKNATAIFIDSSTLTVTTPTLPAGGARVQVSNPGGASYWLDDEFTAQ